ncbi:MAG: leucine-rich repeat domain-containing protein, partial [Parachlamydiaceae bacterium]|nr:leucine-rich repeat domain-containing protein [Parachlamydiaceae bacterium]
IFIIFTTLSFQADARPSPEEIKKLTDIFLTNAPPQIKKILTEKILTGVIKETSHKERKYIRNHFDSFCNSIRWITELDLNNSGIESFPLNFGKVICLKELDISKNHLHTLPDSFKMLNTLSTLCLDDNHFKIFPSSILSLTNLENLYLNENKIETIPEDIKNLIKLKFFSIRENKIEELPDAFSLLKNLKELNLSYNPLQKLPENIQELTALTDLHLSYNQIKKLPENIVYLTNLEILNINDNKLTDLPSNIGALKKLQCLNLCKNNIEILPDSMFLLPELTSLDLDSNKVKQIPENIKNLTKLEYICLKDNVDIKFAPNSIKELSSIILLRLIGTSIPEITNDDTLGRQALRKFFGRKVHFDFKDYYNPIEMQSDEEMEVEEDDLSNVESRSETDLNDEHIIEDDEYIYEYDEETPSEEDFSNSPGAYITNLNYIHPLIYDEEDISDFELPPNGYPETESSEEEF